MKKVLIRWLCRPTLFSAFIPLVVAGGCDQSAKVSSTFPVNGEQNAGSKTTIRVTVSSTFNSKVDTQEELTSPENILVTGERGRVYEGTIAVKTEAAAIQEEALALQGTAAAATSAQPSGSGSNTSSTSNTGTPQSSNTGDNSRSSTSDGSSKASNGSTAATKDGEGSGQTDNNTLVFTLAAGSSFKPGEWIRVRVGGRITVRGQPFDDFRFSFRVKGEGAVQALGDLRIISTAPVAEETRVLQRPRISARFNGAVKPDGLATFIVIRGDHSGVHTAGETVFPRKESDIRILEVAQRLRTDDSLLPGEWVTVTVTDEVQAAVTGTGTPPTGGQGTTPASVTRLSPYAFRFQAMGGRVTGPWVSAVRSQAPSEPRGVVAGNLRPLVEGTEFVVFSEDGLEFFSQKTPGSWSSVNVPNPGTAGSKVSGVAIADVDSDGIAELLVLTTRTAGTQLEGSSIHTFIVGAAGGLVEKEAALEFPAIQANGLRVEDLDNNGHLDLIILHPNRDYEAVVDGKPTPASTGILTVFEKSVGALDPTKINLADLTSLQGTLEYHRVENPLPDLASIRRFEMHDFDGDGKRDMIVEVGAEGANAGQLLLLQNRSTRTDRVRFVSVRSVAGRGGKGQLQPHTWTVADFDSDSDLDLLAWDQSGALLYKNKLDPKTQDPTKPATNHLLSETVIAAELPLGPLSGATLDPAILDLNGDRALDIVLVERDRRLVRVLLGSEQRTAEFESAEISLSIGGRAAGVVVADVNGDTGLDLTVVGDGSGPGSAFELLLATGVEPPIALVPSSFVIDPELSATTESDIAVVVTADIADSFTGYTVVLDYDENRLTFSRFDEPVNFRSVATFSPCPNSSGEGCAGFASVQMAFTQNSRGIKGDGVVLGTFRFKPKSVTEAVRTSIFLAGGFDGPDGKKLVNSLILIDGQSQTASDVELEGEPFVVSLAPPPPPALAITDCAVGELDRGVFPARVVWTSPADALFSRFEVFLDGLLLQTLDALARQTLPFHINTGGSHQVRVRGFGLDGRPVATVECTLSTVFRTDVKCVQIEVNSKKRNQLTWSIPGEVDLFRIAKNGALYKTVLGTVFSDEDSNPSESGADIYEISGVIEEAGRSVVGPPGQCLVADPNPGRTEAPRDLSISTQFRSRPSDPIALRLRWTNSEAYESIRVRITNNAGATVHEEVVPGTATQAIFPNDGHPGGVLPQIYRFSLVATAAGVSSLEAEATSFPLSVFVPGLGAQFTCSAPEGNEVVLKWDPVWQGFTSLTLSIRGPQGDRSIPLDISATEHRETVVPLGSFEYTLRAAYEDPLLPPALRPNASSLARRCSITFRPLLELGPVETGVGLRNVGIPIRADFFTPISGLRFSILVPSQFHVDLSDPQHPETAVTLSGVHENSTVTVEVEPGPNDGQGRSRDRVKVEVQGASFSAGKDKVLLWILGSVDPDFARAGEYPLQFDGTVQVFTPGDPQPLTIEREDTEASLSIRKRFLAIDRVSGDAAHPQPIFLRVLATFDTPEGFEKAEEYRILGFTIHIKFDPSLLDLQVVTKTDQLETVVGSTGTFFIPTGAQFETARRTGDFSVAWIGLLGEEGFVTPGIHQTLLFLKFKPKVPENPAGAFARIELIKDRGAPNPSMFVPERVPNDGPPLEAWFDGGVDIAPVADVPTLLSVSPATGSLIGGGEAVVNGFGFLAGIDRPEEQIQLSLAHRPLGGTPVVRPVEWIPGRPFKNNLLEFKVPGAGLTAPSLFATKFDVELRTPNGHSILPEAYSYEYLRVASASISSGGVEGGQLMTVLGFGFAPLLGKESDPRVEFRIQGTGSPPVFAAEVIEVASNGRRLTLRTPAMPGQAGKVADVVVILPTMLQSDGQPARDTLPQPFSIASGPEVLSVSPSRGPVAGGSKVTIEVARFPQPLTGNPAVEVLFAATAATSIAATGPSTVRATVPAGPAGRVDVTVRHGAASATLREGFEYAPGGAPLALNSVEPADGSICGGKKVIVRGSGFTSSLQVRFGSALSAGVRFIDASSAEVTTPSVPEGTQAVNLGVSLDGSQFVEMASAFAYRDERPLFIRGDADGNGVHNITDAIAISDLVTGVRRVLPHLDAADVNDDGLINSGDLVALTAFLFEGSGTMPAPYPAPGRDLTPDSLRGCSP